MIISNYLNYYHPLVSSTEYIKAEIKRRAFNLFRDNLRVRVSNINLGGGDNSTSNIVFHRHFRASTIWLPRSDSGS